MLITIHLKVITKEAPYKVTYPVMVDFGFYSVSYEMNFSALLTLYRAFSQLKTSQHSAYFSTTGFITPCLAYPIPWQQTAFNGSTPRDVFMQTFSFLGANASLSQSSFLLHDDVLGFFPSLG